MDLCGLYPYKYLPKHLLIQQIVHILKIKMIKIILLLKSIFDFLKN